MQIDANFGRGLIRIDTIVSLVCFRVRKHLKTLADGSDPMQIDANFGRVLIRIDTFVSFRIICDCLLLG